MDHPPQHAAGARYDRGWAALTEVNGGPTARVIDELREVAPDLARFVVEFAYGDVYDRPVLTRHQRQLVTIGMLATMGGCEPQLEVHVHVALNVGVSPDEIVETLLHAVPFCGFPRVINAMQVVRRVFERRGVRPTAVPPATGAP